MEARSEVSYHWWATEVWGVARVEHDVATYAMRHSNLRRGEHIPVHFRVPPCLFVSDGNRSRVDLVFALEVKAARAAKGQTRGTGRRRRQCGAGAGVPFVAATFH